MIAIFKSHKLRHVIVTKMAGGISSPFPGKSSLFSLGGIVPLKIAKSNRIVMKINNNLTLAMESLSIVNRITLKCYCPR